MYENCHIDCGGNNLTACRPKWKWSYSSDTFFCQNRNSSVIRSKTPKHLTIHCIRNNPRHQLESSAQMTITVHCWCSVSCVDINVICQIVSLENPVALFIKNEKQHWMICAALRRNSRNSFALLINPCLCRWRKIIPLVSWFAMHDSINNVSVILVNIMMTSSNGNIFRVTGHLCGKFTGHRRIPRTKVSNAELWCFLWSASEKNGWVNNREAGDLRHYCAHYDVTVMISSGNDFVAWWPHGITWTNGNLPSIP